VANRAMIRAAELVWSADEKSPWFKEFKKATHHPEG
jgi:hypothetical protein